MSRLKKSKVPSISKENRQSLCKYAAQYGRCVRQRTVRQETTMAKAGTLPEYCYLPVEGQCHAPVDIDDEPKINEEVEEYESSDDEIEDRLSCNSDDSGSDSDLPIPNAAQQAESTNSQNLFLIGRVSRFGRAVRLNSRFIT